MRLKLKSSPSYIDLSDEIGRTSDVRSRAGKKAKTKGASFERRIAKSLGDWWEVKFYRTPQSGGSHLKEGYELAGDIATPAQDFRFHVECKNQESWSLHGLMTSPKSAVWKWWEQTLSDCPKDREPLLIFTKNHLPSFTLMYGELLDMVICDYLSSEGKFEDRSRITVGDVSIITLDSFLSIPKSAFVSTFQQSEALHG